MKTYETTLKRTARGFRRFLGGERFDLGHDKEQAAKRLEAIMALWDESNADRGTWKPESLSAAKAIAKGATPVLLANDFEMPEKYFGRVAKLMHLGVPVVPDDKYEEGRKYLVERIESNRKQLAGHSGKKATGQFLHDALDDWGNNYVKKEFKEPDGIVSIYGGKLLTRIKLLKDRLPNHDLGELDLQGCDSLFAVFRQRPFKKDRKGKLTTKVMARKTCYDINKDLKRMLQWVHIQKEWEWRKPEDFDTLKLQPREFDEDVERESEDKPMWTVEELKVLWEYASPLQRVVMLLSLNCAYGADQTGRLRIKQCRLDDVPPNITRVRRKKKVKATHQLWDITTQALRWVIARRQQSDLMYVLLTKEGLPYYRKLDSSNASQDLPNLWNRLLDRVRRDHTEFRRLPFNVLRDTSSNMIRQIAGGEIARLHLSHKHQSTDPNLAAYTNPLRKKHARAIVRLGEQLKSVFERVADPFPEGQESVQRGGGDNITPAQKAKIKSMHAQGFKKVKIAELVGVSTVTVWRHTRKRKAK